MTKQHILDEIQSTAENGKALGLARFETKTGIKVHHWRGKYWATWGDAIKEAGLTSNDWNPAFEESFLLESVLHLTRKLQKYPTKAEMDLERRSNPTIPTSSAIFRFAPKSELLRKLIAYCDTNSGFTDLKAIVAGAANTSAEDETPVSDDRSESGYVYLVKAQGAYKIGLSRAPYRRVSEIVSQSARGAELVHIIRTDDPEGIEKYWHSRFDNVRISGANKQSGEWFQLSARDVAAFKRRKEFM